MDEQTPADEAATGAAPSMDELLSRRHQPQPAHEPHREVGAAPSDDDDDGLNPPPADPQPPSAQAAPTPEKKPDPAGNAGDPPPDPDEEKGPKWYRDSMKRMRQENARLRAQSEGRPTGQPSPQTQPQPRPQPRELPNPAEDPIGYAQAIQEIADERAAQRFNTQAENFRLEHKLETSADRLIERHGEDILDEVREWLISKASPDGKSNPMEAWAMSQRDPWAAALKQMQNERLAEEIGNDPEAYKKRLRDEWDAELAARNGAPQDPPAERSTMTPPQRRAAPPPPSSTVRGAQPRDNAGRFSGAPLKFRNFE